MADIVVTARLENTCDRGVVEQGYSDASAVRATSMEVVVNTATAMLMLPETVVECLGLEVQQSAMVVNDDGSREIRPIAGPVTIELSGRSTCTSCLVGPPASVASVGRIVLLQLDLIVGGPGLYPRHPDYPLLRL